MGFWDAATTGFNSGMDWAERRGREDRDFALRKEQHTAAMEEQAARMRALRAAETDQAGVRDARNALISADRDGMMVGGVKGLSAPSTQMAFQGQAGYGSGASAVKDMAGDYAREGNRMGFSPQAYDASSVSAAPATDRQMLGLRKTLALRQGQDIAPMLTEGKRLTAREAAAARAKDPAYMEQVIGQFNLDGAQPMTIADVMDPKTNKPTGYRQLHLVDPKTGKASKFDLSPDDARRVVYARELIEAGLDDEGHAALKGVNSDLAARIKALNDTADKAVSSGNQAANFADDARYRQGQLGISQQQLSLARDRALAEKSQILNPQMNYQVGPDGIPRPVITGLRLNTRTGNYDPVVQPMGASGTGIIPSRALEPENIAKMAEGLVGKPIPGAMKDGKPVAYDTRTAYEAAQKQVISGYAPGVAKPAADPNVSKMFADAPRPGARPAPQAQPAYPVDAARARVADAERTLQRYGLRQRSTDPEGFQAALQAARDARAELDAVPVDAPNSAVFRYAAP